MAIDRIGFPRVRFGTVLLLLLALVVLLVSVDVGGEPRLMLELASAAVLLIAVTSATEERRHRRTALGLGLAAGLLHVGSFTGWRPWNIEVGAVMSVLVAAYATSLLLGGVVRSRRVTGDVLAGALAAYIMAGLSFAMAYGVISAVRPEAFRVPAGAVVSFADLVYFSFVTLLTIGFGDVTPALPLARALALLEGLFGVVFTTIVLASLVAAYLTDPHDRRGSREEG